MGANRELQDAFLNAFSVHGEIKKSAEVAKVARQSHYYWMANDDEYRARFKALRYNVCQQIEDALVERLAFGWDEPVFQQGVEVGRKRKFDNSAAIAYLDRHDPDFIKGKKQNVDVTSNGTNPSVSFMMPNNGRGPDVGTLVEQLAASEPEYLEWKRQQMIVEDAQ